MQVLVLYLVFCFYFVNFSTTNKHDNMCMCVNLAAGINRDVGKVLKLSELLQKA